MLGCRHMQLNNRVAECSCHTKEILADVPAQAQAVEIGVQVQITEFTDICILSLQRAKTDENASARKKTEQSAILPPVALCPFKNIAVEVWILHKTCRIVPQRAGIERAQALCVRCLEGTQDRISCFLAGRVCAGDRHGEAPVYGCRSGWY